MTLRFERDDLTRPEVHGLLQEHLADMYATSPAESVHALDPEALRGPGVRFWTVWEGDELLGCGALADTVEGALELKSMRTAHRARGRGVGAAMLRHLLAEAHGLGAARVLLETGSEEFFAPARRLYARFGSRERPPFGDYRADPNSVFMELSVAAGQACWPSPNSTPPSWVS